MTAEKEELGRRKAYREETGKRNPRPSRAQEERQSMSQSRSSSWFFTVRSKPLLETKMMTKIAPPPGLSLPREASMNGPSVKECSLMRDYDQRQNSMNALERVTADMKVVKLRFQKMDYEINHQWNSNPLLGLSQIEQLRETKEELWALQERQTSLAREIGALSSRLKRNLPQELQPCLETEQTKELSVSAEDRLRRSVPAKVYELFMAVEIRAVQRMRLAQERNHNVPAQSYRKWKRVLYSRMRMRIFLYQKARQLQDEKRLDYDPRDFRSGQLVTD